MASRSAQIALLALAAILLGGCGLTASRSNPGYANLDSLGMNDVDNVMTLSLGTGLLRFAAKHTQDDPETQALLNGLDGVRVRLYEIDGDAARVAARMNRMGGRLQNQGWNPVAVTRDEDETVHMLLKRDNERMVGMLVLVVDENEAVIVNLMGELQPEMFSDAMVALDVDVAQSIEIASLP